MEKLSEISTKDLFLNACSLTSVSFLIFEVSYEDRKVSVRVFVC